MNAQTRQFLFRSIGRLLTGERVFRRSRSAPPEPPLYQEMKRSARVGLGACLAYALILSAPVAVLVSATVLGYCSGAVVGLVLWNGSAGLPEDPVLPPAPGQERYAPAGGG